MHRVRHFVIVLISVIAASACFAQSSSASATSQAPILIASNDVAITGITHDASTSVDLSPAVLPDAPSSLSPGLNLQPVRLQNGANTSTDGSQSYDETTMPAQGGKMTRMINAIVNRMDLSDLANAPCIRGNTGPSGDATFAMNQHLALVGAYEHNSRPSFDTMAFGVAFTFGHN